VETLDLNDNKLTGSVPVTIVSDRTYDSFNVNGNQLSDLIPVDGQTICTNINNDTGVEGEHYCNCASDCLFVDENFVAVNCQCEEAQNCCDTYLVDNNITNCLLCEAEAGFSNADFVVEDWGVSCSDGGYYVYFALGEFGTEKQCNDARVIAYTEGCICPNYVPPVPEEDADLPL